MESVNNYEMAYGSTGNTRVVFLFDTSGQPVTGLGPGDVTAWNYWHEGDSSTTTHTAANALATPALDDAHEDGGFLEIGGGFYRIDFEDAIAAFGAHGTVYGWITATGTDTVPFTISLVLPTQTAKGDVQADASPGASAVTVEASKNIKAGDLVQFFDPADGTNLGAYGVDAYDSGTGVITIQDPGGVHTALTTSHDWRTLIGARSADVNVEHVGGDPQDIIQSQDTFIDAMYAAARADHQEVGSIGEAMNTIGDDGSTIATTLLAQVIENGVTVKQSFALSNAAAAGKATGMGTSSAALRNLADTINRIAATTDDDGNRSAVTLDFSDGV